MAHVVEHQAENFNLDTDQIRDRLPEILCLIAWQKIGELVAKQASAFKGQPDSVNGAIKRMASTLATLLDWHS